jgi:hypothetical protein
MSKYNEMDYEAEHNGRGLCRVLAVSVLLATPNALFPMGTKDVK